VITYTLKQIEYFVAVSEAGSIALAAERIYVSPPSISVSITQLEQQLGIQLFVRHHARGLSLTPGGRRLLAEAKGLLAQADAVVETAAQITRRPHGPIRIGCFVSLAPLVMPAVHRSFAAAYPHARVSQVEANQHELLAALHGAEIDVALTYDLDIPSDIEFEPLAELPPHVLVAGDHRWARRRFVTLEMLSEEPMVLLDIPYSSEYFLSLFHENNLRVRVAERAGSTSMLRSMVANGFGYALANIRPKSDLAPDGKRLVSLKLKGDFRPMILGIAVTEGEDRPMIVEEFRKLCRKLIGRNRIPGMSLPSKPAPARA